MPTIVALVKNVPDTWSVKTLRDDNWLDRKSVDVVLDEINEYSVEQALQVREAEAEKGTGYQVVAISMGPADNDQALRKALAMGADDAIHVTDDALAGSDALGTAWALHNAIATLEDVRLIVAGNYSSDGSTGAVAGLLAEYGQLPALTSVHEVTVDGESISATREDNRGVWQLKANLPALVTVTDKAASPRYPNFKGLMAAKKFAITTFDLSAIGVDPAQVGGAHATTQMHSHTKRPARAAGEIIDSGSAEDQARQIADYLEANQLI